MKKLTIAYRPKYKFHNRPRPWLIMMEGKKKPISACLTRDAAKRKMIEWYRENPSSAPVLERLDTEPRLTINTTLGSI